MPQVQLTDVSLTYTSASKETRALAGVSLTVEAGEPIALIGPSGCGKSSILKLIAGLREPSEGSVTVAGERLESPRGKTALILQNYGLLPWKTVLDNAALGLRIAGVPRSEAAAAAQVALATVGLSEFERSFPAELSGGMAQRLALARAMALEADIMLMDEPLSAIDSLTREDLQGVLLDLWLERGYSQVLVTHSIEEAVFLGRRIAIMTPRPGQIHSILQNPGMGTREYRDTAEFYRVCAEVRSCLVDEGALAR